MLTNAELEFVKRVPNELRELNENIGKQTKALNGFLESQKRPVAIVAGSTGADGLRQTREEVIDLSYTLSAIIRKAQCRQVNGDIIDSLDTIRKELRHLENDLTDIIGD